MSLLQGILQKGPFVRFAWGVGTDNRLNHHPAPPPGKTELEWGGRRFDPKNPKLYARVERQVLWAIPNKNRALFTIRTYFQDMAEMKKTNPDAVKGLIEAIFIDESRIACLQRSFARPRSGGGVAAGIGRIGVRLLSDAQRVTSSFLKASVVKKP